MVASPPRPQTGPDLAATSYRTDPDAPFGGMQWRVAGWLSGVPFTTLHSTFARWARPGLWRRLGQRLAGDWRLACDDEVLPSAVCRQPFSALRPDGLDAGH